MQILNLRETPAHLPVVADRIWRAWWKPNGDPLSDVEAELKEIVAAETFPFTLVAVENGIFVGTVSGIASDLTERPQLTPWIAALWVEPAFRRKGVARTLVARAAEGLLARSVPIYLYAVRELRDLYLRLGWQLVEERVGKHGVDIFVLTELTGISSPSPAPP